MTRVELVEDDVLLASGFVASLEAAGFTVHHSRHAVEAIAAIDAQPPDVLVLDVILPVASGFSLLHELQSYADTAAVPVILCTSMASQLSLEAVRPYGVRAVLDKTTMRPSDLVAAVQEAAA